MRSSTFLCGVILGAAAGVMASKRKFNWMSMMSEAGSALSLAGMKTGKECHNGQARSTSSRGSTLSAQVFPSQSSSSTADHSKEYTVSQIKDFIKGNPEVLHEVESILKESNTQIPGL
ncbi:MULTISPECIES: hypothetical protein [unclassified Paenibacillus]|uniref:hypothetical protein n=1 Tax=unclassified Paenibacillus TaxID=185978 RepID=UPI000838A1FE|nr:MULTISPECIES: hypothetical protein [unclassified Paenibacillus]NWL87333.1 hypothetical protein [Paenibacillus sp. 79R4]